MTTEYQRREFLRQMGAGILGGGVLASGRVHAEERSSGASIDVGTIKDLPTRKLGRIDFKAPLLSFGTAPMGHAYYKAEPFEEVMNAAIDAGITYLDTARVYDVAEDRLKPVLARRRREVFLVTKTWTRTRDETLKSLDKSMTAMGVDQVDLCHMHNVGQFTREEAIGKGGLLEGLIEARKRGLIKHIGCTGHLNTNNFAPVLETGEIEVLMCTLNFVDRFTYDFEQRVLPLAREKGVAIVPMKVFGGIHTVWEGYRKREDGRLATDEFRQDAIDYALGLPGVSTLVVGMKTVRELRENIAAVRNHKPLAGERKERVLARGKAMAKQWGDRFGPAVAKDAAENDSAKS